MTDILFENIIFLLLFSFFFLEYESKMSELLQSLHAVEGAFVQQREQYELQLRQEASTREEELRRMSQRLSEQLRSAEER